MWSAPAPPPAEGLAGLDRPDIREGLSPWHAPDVIRVVRAALCNRTGKKLEIPVKRVLEGVPLEEATSLNNTTGPETLGTVERLERELRPA